MATKDLTMTVDDQMLLCLEIMAHGEDMLAIGAWEAPIKRLTMKEYAAKIGNGYRITDAGRAFFAQTEGVSFADVAAMEPPRPDWIVTLLPGEPETLVVLRKNELTVSGYEALTGRWVPAAHGHMNDGHTVAVSRDVTGFLQAVLDVAWARGLRPTDAAT